MAGHGSGFRYYLFTAAGELVGTCEVAAALVPGDVVLPASAAGTPAWRVVSALGRAATVVPSRETDASV